MIGRELFQSPHSLQSEVGDSSLPLLIGFYVAEGGGRAAGPRSRESGARCPERRRPGVGRDPGRGRARRRVVWLWTASPSRLGSFSGPPKAFVRGLGEDEVREVPNGVHDFQAGPQRPVLQHPVLRLLSCPHRDDYPGDLVHGKGAGGQGRATRPLRMRGKWALGWGAGTWDVEVGVGRYFSGCFNCELRLGDFERWGSRGFGRGTGIRSLFGEYTGLHPRPPERIIVVFGVQPAFGRCFVRMEKERKDLQLSFSFSFSPLFVFFFFVKAFGDIARKASILNLNASQDLHWVNFPGYTPLLAYQVLFITSDRKSCLLRACYVPADTYFFWAPGSV